DPFTLMLPGQVAQRHAGALLEGREALSGHVAVGGPGQAQDELTGLQVGLDPGASGGSSLPFDAVEPAQLLDVLLHVVGDAVGSELLVDLSDVPFDLDEGGHGQAVDRLALAGLPVPLPVVWGGHRAWAVVLPREGGDLGAGGQVRLGEVAVLLGDRGAGNPVG